MSLQKLSLLSLTACLSQPSTPPARIAVVFSWWAASMLASSLYCPYVDWGGTGVYSEMWDLDMPCIPAQYGPHAKSLHRRNSGTVSTVPPTGQLSARFVILYYLQPLFLFLSGCPPGSVFLYNLYPLFLALPRYPPRSVSLCYLYPPLLRWHAIPIDLYSVFCTYVLFLPLPSYPTGFCSTVLPLAQLSTGFCILVLPVSAVPPTRPVVLTTVSSHSRKCPGTN